MGAPIALSMISWKGFITQLLLITLLLILIKLLHFAYQRHQLINNTVRQ